MDTRKVVAEYRMAQWAGLLQTKKSQGQTVADFCQTEGISKNTYFCWQRKLREAACTQLATQGAEADVPNGWARLMPARTPGTESGVKIEVGGCLITATSETDPELLLKVCRALKSLC